MVTNHIDELIFAIIVVLELPPSESCKHGKRFNNLHQVGMKNPEDSTTKKHLTFHKCLPEEEM
jgi:hypothetical protein